MFRIEHEFDSEWGYELCLESSDRFEFDHSFEPNSKPYDHDYLFSDRYNRNL